MSTWEPYVVTHATCRHCGERISSDTPNAGGAAWRDEETGDWACRKNERRGLGNFKGYGPHRPEVTPGEIEAAVASIQTTIESVGHSA